MLMVGVYIKKINKSTLKKGFFQGRLVKDVMGQVSVLVKNAEIIGRYSCQGEVDSKVLYKLGKGTRPFP
ncbi:MAG: hypothetical protein CSA34_05720 [Desulfobulbus propionicus]|nr:MAG: hypothetical protein CSA34_05720 [Desulfobulbus propionicus]